MKKKRVFILFFILAFVIAGFSKNYNRVSVSIKPLQLITKEIVGKSVDVHLIVPPGSSPHTFQLTIKEAVNLNNSDALIIVGAGLEQWLSKVEGKFSKNHRVFKLSDYFKNFIGKGKRVNPHLWLSLKSMIEIIPNLKAFLTNIYPEKKYIFEKNTKSLIKRLKLLDKELSEKFRLLKNKGVVMYHPVWAYFLRDYNIKVIETIEKKPGETPSPRRVVEIINKIKKEKGKVIIGEPNVSEKWVRMIAKSSNAKVAILDPLGFSKGIKTYEDLIKINAENLIKYLK